MSIGLPHCRLQDINPGERFVIIGDVPNAVAGDQLNTRNLMTRFSTEDKGGGYDAFCHNGAQLLHDMDPLTPVLRISF